MDLLKYVFWNADQSRLRTIWRFLILLILFILLKNLPGLFIHNKAGQGGGSDSITSWYLILIGFVRLLPALISVWIVGRFIDRRSITDFVFQFNKEWWKDFAFGLGLGAFLMTCIFAIEYSSGWISIVNYFHMTNNNEPFIIPASGCFFIFICVGIGEEVIFRGYQIKNFAEGFYLNREQPWKGVLIALIISSALFGLWHWENPNATLISTLNIMMGGLFFSLGFMLTKQLALSIGVHISWNFFQGNVFGLPVSGITLPSNLASVFKVEQSGPVIWTGGAFGPEAGILALIMFVIGIVLLIGWVRFRYNKVIIKTELAIFTTPYTSIHNELN
jgi:membrane protease YdiL (CAAX protease family)